MYRLVGTFHSNVAMEMAVREWLQIQKHEFHSDEIFKLMLVWERYVNVLGEYVE